MRYDQIKHTFTAKALVPIKESQMVTSSMIRRTLWTRFLDWLRPPEDDLEYVKNPQVRELIRAFRARLF